MQLRIIVPAGLPLKLYAGSLPGWTRICIHVQLKEDMYEIQVSSGLTLTVLEANYEFCCRNLKKLATEKRRQ